MLISLNPVNLHIQDRKMKKHLVQAVTIENFLYVELEEFLLQHHRKKPEQNCRSYHSYMKQDHLVTVIDYLQWCLWLLKTRLHLKIKYSEFS